MVRILALELRRILKPDGSFFLNFNDGSDNPFFAFEVAVSMKRLFQLQNTIHWIKSISIEREGETNSFGHFKPINSKRYLNDCHEYVFHFTSEGKTKLDRLAIGVPYADKSNIKRWSHTDGKDSAVEGTQGSYHIKRFIKEPSSAHTPPHSRPNSP